MEHAWSKIKSNMLVLLTPSDGLLCLRPWCQHSKVQPITTQYLISGPMRVLHSGRQTESDGTAQSDGQPLFYLPIYREIFPEIPRPPGWVGGEYKMFVCLNFRRFPEIVMEIFTNKNCPRFFHLYFPLKVFIISWERFHLNISRILHFYVHICQLN